MGTYTALEGGINGDIVYVKDTRKDIVVGAGEGLEAVQVAEDGSDDFLKTETIRAVWAILWRISLLGNQIIKDNVDDHESFHQMEPNSDPNYLHLLTEAVSSHILLSADETHHEHENILLLQCVFKALNIHAICWCCTSINKWPWQAQIPDGKKIRWEVRCECRSY